MANKLKAAGAAICIFIKLPCYATSSMTKDGRAVRIRLMSGSVVAAVRTGARASVVNDRISRRICILTVLYTEN